MQLLGADCHFWTAILLFKQPGIFFPLLNRASTCALDLISCNYVGIGVVSKGVFFLCQFDKARIDVMT